MQPSISKVHGGCCKSTEIIIFTSVLFLLMSEGREDPIVSNPQAAGKEDDPRWRRACGCLRTSDKLKKILNTFPSTPPPSPFPFALKSEVYETSCGKKIVEKKISSECMGHAYKPLPHSCSDHPVSSFSCKGARKSWQMVGDLIQLVQLSVTATALALYYLIYCYMQLVYFTLKSAMYFHRADGPMKITIGVVTLTSILVGFNIALRIEKIFEIFS